jgi:hypothetical protein
MATPMSDSISMTEGVVPKTEVGAPDEARFSPGLKKGEEAVTWGSLRQLTNDDYRLAALSARIRSFLIEQTSAILEKKAYAPFPLTAVTLIGIGSLGEIFYADAADPHDEDRNLILFCEFCDSIDKRFPRAPNKNFKEAFASRWRVEKPRSISRILYTFFRNSFVHGYYGRSVFLTGDETPDITLRDDGCVLLQPDWFYGAFRHAAENHLVRMQKEKKDGRLRRNGLAYVRKLIDERD